MQICGIKETISNADIHFSLSTPSRRRAQIQGG